MDLKDKEGKCWIFKDGKIKENIFTLISTEGEEFSINFGYIDDIKFFTDYVKYHGKDTIDFKEFVTSKVLKNYVTYKTSGKLKYKDLLEECEEFGEYILDTKFRYDVFMISNDLKDLEKLIDLDQSSRLSYMFKEGIDTEEVRVEMKEFKIHNSCYEFFQQLHNKSDFYRLILPTASLTIENNVPIEVFNRNYIEPIIGNLTFMELNTEENINMLKKAAKIVSDNYHNKKQMLKEFKNEFE